MRTSTILLAALAAMTLIAPPALAQEQSPGQQASLARTLDELLNLVSEGRARDAETQQERLERFRERKSEQAALLEEARQRRDALQARSAELEAAFETGEERLGELELALDQRMGDLKELFGVLQQVAGDVRGLLRDSVTSTQFLNREDFLNRLIDKAGGTGSLPSVGEIEQLWFEMQREMTESGKTVTYPVDIIGADGDVREAQVSRVGVFNALADGKYLRYEPETGKLVELPRQPDNRYVSVAEEFETTSADRADFWVDPTRGSLLGLLIQTPNLKERIDQGGLVGYIILALGALALIIALERLVTLGLVGSKVNRQLKSDEVREDNPLGRVLKTWQANREKDQETVELKVGESILAETPKLQRSLTLLKIISVVAPLLGLLGTVTGMINTFQAITLFGTGDPKLMAGGISQALVTTVLGLAVAIPTVLLHTLVSGRARRIVQVLEERAMGIVAAHSERGVAYGSAA
ncbi:MAG: MotA/TolQ/ExbB proton channel family protein [Gammaproteobacteria bacterium]